MLEPFPTVPDTIADNLVEILLNNIIVAIPDISQDPKDLILRSMHLQALQILYKFFTSSARFLDMMALSRGQLMKLQLSTLLQSDEEKDVKFALKFC